MVKWIKGLAHPQFFIGVPQPRPPGPRPKCGRRAPLLRPMPRGMEGFFLSLPGSDQHPIYIKRCVLPVGLIGRGQKIRGEGVQEGTPLEDPKEQ